MARITAWLGRFRVEEKGQDIVEYSLLLCFVIGLLMSLMGWGQDSMKGIWSRIGNTITIANHVAGTD